MKNESAPVSDVFATQAIIAVLFGILLFALNLTAPAYLRTLLQYRQDTADAAPELPEILARAAAWFASRSAG